MGEEDTVDASSVDEGGAPDTAETNTGTAEGGEDTSHEESDTPKAQAPLQEEAKADVDEEPPSRKPRTPADWVALRRQRKLEREMRKAEVSKGEEEGADDEVSPEDARIIDQRVQKHLEPIIREREEQILKSEITDFITKNPEFKQYATKAEKWAKHPSWENVPTEQLMYAIAGRDLLKIGAEKRAQADAKARQTKVAGGSAQGATGTKPVWEMTDAEFSKEVERVKLGQK